MPPLDTEARLELETSLVAEGCRDPIVIWGKCIVDGHNRYSFCRRHRLPFATVKKDFVDRLAAKLWIISNQAGRRNLTTVERAALAVRYEELIHKQWARSDKPQKKKNGTNQAKPRRRKIAADKYNVSEESVARLKYIEKHGGELLVEAVKAEKKSLNAAYKEVRAQVARDKEESRKDSPRFNRTTDSIEWAKWSWNPFTGCLGPKGDGVLCAYCYAADMAKRFPQTFNEFNPTLHCDRLGAPFHTPIPKLDRDLPGIHNVFLVSMGDLAWAEKAHVDGILATLRRCEKENSRQNPKIPPWIFIILTKVPHWLTTIEWPSNVWVGATVDIQERVAPAIKAMSEIDATVKFLSVEPLLEPINFITGKTVEALQGEKKLLAISAGKDFVNGLSYVDWVIIGSRSKTSTGPEFQPKWAWVERIQKQARSAGCKLYFKPNLKVRPKEYPE